MLAVEGRACCTAAGAALPVRMPAFPHPLTRWPPSFPLVDLMAPPCPALVCPADEFEARAKQIDDDVKHRLEAAVPEAQPAGLLESAGCEHLSE
jgi:hypothetical protein